MPELFDYILKHLRDKFPQFKIEFRQKTKELKSLWVEDKKLADFNPDQLMSEIEWFKDRDDFIELASSFFVGKIKEFYKKLYKRNRWSGGLTIQEIKNACNNTKSNMAAARYAKVSYNTWRKYAQMYINEDDDQEPKRNYFETQLNAKGLGITKPHNPKIGRYSIEAIMAGHCSPNYPTYKLKLRLIQTGYKNDECDMCGFSEKRLTDGKTPIILNFKDGDPQNRRYENLEFLCYNCYYLNVGNIYWGKKGPHKKSNPEEKSNEEKK